MCGPSSAKPGQREDHMSRARGSSKAAPAELVRAIPMPLKPCAQRQFGLYYFMSRHLQTPYSTTSILRYTALHRTTSCLACQCDVTTAARRLCLRARSARCRSSGLAGAQGRETLGTHAVRRCARPVQTSLSPVKPSSVCSRTNDWPRYLQWR